MAVVAVVSSVGMAAVMALHRGASAAPTVPAPPLDGLMLFGFFMSIVALVCWGYERESKSFVMGLGVSLGALAVYAFLQGAWPLGILVAAWSVATVRRWWREKFVSRHKNRAAWLMDAAPEKWTHESRISRMFGPTSKN
ncbi:MAG: hypothetical protein M3O30_18530 [Planctomycetota bacterium]|nr:hypothetical protein [Planctomycetota bacterium]